MLASYHPTRVVIYWIEDTGLLKRQNPSPGGLSPSGAGGYACLSQEGGGNGEASDAQGTRQTRHLGGGQTPWLRIEKDGPIDNAKGAGSCMSPPAY